MPKNKNAMLRMLTLDACFRDRRHRYTLEDLVEKCREDLEYMEGIGSICERTIQRDIRFMRSEKGYNAEIEVVERKYYRYEDPEFSITKLPLSKKDLAELSSAMDIIKNYQGFSGMGGQEDILARMQDQIQSQESHQQVVFIETNARLKGLNFLGPLYDFIVKRQAISVRYHSFKAARETVFNVSPYLLKEFNNRWFLVCYNKKMRDIQTMALDRMVAVEADKRSSFVENTFFDPQTYFSEMVGVSRAVNNKPIRVTLRVDKDQAPYVLTKPLHESQELIRENKDGSILVVLTVIQNLELQRLLLGFGAHIEVLSPYLLRHNIARALLMASAMYQ